MLDDVARISHYQAQNGFGSRLTPRQQRRINHKRGHQTREAAAVREERSAAQAKARAVRKKQRTTPALSPR